MTVTVRSSAGGIDTNDTSPELDSPASITAGDLLACVWMVNTSTAQTITPPAGWSEDGDLNSATSGSSGSRYMLFTKTATATDATNQGTTDYYVFSGLALNDDVLGCIFSLYDSGAGTVTYRAGSMADNAQTGGGGTTTAPTQTVVADGSMSLSCWAARDGTAQFWIDVNEAYAPTGGTNSTLHHAAWVANVMSGSEWVVGTSEWDISDSPIGQQDLTHDSLATDVDGYSVSMIFEVASTTTSSDGSGRGIGRGISRGVG